MREIVTSENREDYMNKKMAAKRGMSVDEHTESKEKAKKMDYEQHERVKKHPKYASLKAKLGKRGAMDAILKELNEAK